MARSKARRLTEAEDMDDMSLATGEVAKAAGIVEAARMRLAMLLAARR